MFGREGPGQELGIVLPYAGLKVGEGDNINLRRV